MQIVPAVTDPGPQNLDALRGKKGPEAVKAVAKEMEALFAYELIKVMRETVRTGPQGLGSETYMTMFDMELSRLFAERGLGLRASLERGLSSLARKAEKTPSAPETTHDSTAPSAAVKALPEKPAPEEKPLPQSPGQAVKAGIEALLPELGRLRISSGYGIRSDPFSGKKTFHHGVDIPAPEGADIHAVRGGTVIFSGEQRGYGNVVIIDHGDGFVTKYAHNQKNLVREGDTVVPGAVIAQVGTTGKSTGFHVHFEVLYEGRGISPGTFLAKG